MWRGLAKRASKERLRFFSIPSSKPVQDSCFNVVYHQFSGPSCQNPNLSRSSCSIPGTSFGLPPFRKAYGTAAAQVVVSTDESELSGSDELLEIIRETEEPEGKLAHPFRRPGRKTMMAGMGVAKYAMLKKRQVKMETDAWEQAAKEYEELLSDMCEQKLAPNLPYVKSLFLGWFEPLRNAIKVEQKVAKNNFRCPYGQYFDQLPADMMAVITMHKMMGMLLTSNGGEGNVKVVLAALAVGEAIEQEARIYKVMEKTKCKSNVKNNELDGESNALTHDEQKLDKEQDKLIQEKLRKKMALLMKKQKGYALRKVVKGQDDSVPWGQDIQAKVGSRMIQLLIETAYIQPPVDQINDGPPDILPAFVHAMKTVTDSQHQSKRYGVIECDPLVRRGLEKSARHMVIPYLPMLVPPLNWRGYDKGAYFFLPSFVMRTHGAKQQREAVKRTPLEKLEPVFEALDTLGNTKWRVNKRVLAVVDRIWASGGGLASLVDREDLAFPEEPDTEDEAEIKKWKWQVKNTKKENSERHSQRCDVELKLAVARKLRDEEGFYYPHNLDFRGRAYPMHPHLNHLGSDLCRGILEFAEGRPLGKSGLQWLKIHLANQYGGGVDKLSFEGRATFAENHINDIFDSADQPLEGRRWWLSAEDPFQCLATCINLAEALRSSSPHTTISHLPIHQDGSCNGLQHYAALGRDELGAASVNLVGQEKPADVYSRIAERVLDIMQRDAEKDPATDPDALLARALVHQVDRKLVKQTVMTSVYGVTYVGARDQINRRLKERGAVTDDPWKPACYAAKTTLKALEEMFDGARSIMAWLGECAKLIANPKMNKPVRWTTPLGLPVVQPYFKEGRHLIKTSLQTLALKRDTDKVKAVKQKTAFPPNFVHSLDGSHMMMTAVACKKAGLNFAGVHDSYWTHASDVDEMNRILREKFVELYETPILENLLEGFEKSFPGLKFPPLPERGDFDLKRVLESQYFFN